jgi:segregation and condensation protein B
MSNKNTKKRRRVVMTSDVVPAGTRDHVLGADKSPEESAPSGELETSRPEGEASAAVEPAAVQVEGPIAGQMLVQVTPERRRRLASKSKPPPAARADEEESPATMAAAERASADDRTEDDEESDVERDEDVGAAERDEASAGARDDSDETSESDEERARGNDDGAADDATTDDAITEEIDPRTIAASLDANDDEQTEPAARSDELWVPEETEPAATTEPAADLSRAHLKGLIEALVFVSDQPLTVNDIAKAAGRADRKLVKALADELRQDYARRGIHLDEVAGGLIFRTNPAYGPFIRDAAAKKPVRMTRAQLETLSIIAYRQPLTRPEVDEVRGVDSGPVMKMLLERDLIKILGKKDEPGRPLLYGTTQAFLEFFGLKALKDLPSLREFTELSDDSRRTFDREMADSPDAPADLNLATLAAAASAAGTAETGASSLEEDAGAPSVDAEANAPNIDASDVEPSTVRAAEESVSEDFADAEEPTTSVDELGAVTAEVPPSADLPTDDAPDEDPAEARNDESGAAEDADPDSEPPHESESEPDELA